MQRGSLGFPCMVVGAHRMLGDQVQVIGDEVKYLFIPEPAGGMAMDFPRRRLKDEHMTAVFQGGHVGVEGLPVIAHQRHPVGGRELVWNALAVQDTASRLPTARFALLPSAPPLD